MAKVIVKQAFLRSLERVISDPHSSLFPSHFPMAGKNGSCLICDFQCKGCPFYGNVNKYETALYLSSSDPYMSKLDALEFVDEEVVIQDCMLREWHHARRTHASLHIWAVKIYSLIMTLLEEKRKGA